MKLMNFKPLLMSTIVLTFCSFAHAVDCLRSTKAQIEEAGRTLSVDQLDALSNICQSQADQLEIQNKNLKRSDPGFFDAFLVSVRAMQFRAAAMSKLTHSYSNDVHQLTNSYKEYDSSVEDTKAQMKSLNADLQKTANALEKHQ